MSLLALFLLAALTSFRCHGQSQYQYQYLTIPGLNLTLLSTTSAIPQVMSWGGTAYQLNCTSPCPTTSSSPSTSLLTSAYGPLQLQLGPVPNCSSCTAVPVGVTLNLTQSAITPAPTPSPSPEAAQYHTTTQLIPFGCVLLVILAVGWVIVVLLFARRPPVDTGSTVPTEEPTEPSH
eukprot:RCo032833